MAVRWTAHIPQALQRHRGCVAPRPEDVRHEAEIRDALHVAAPPMAPAEVPQPATEPQRGRRSRPKKKAGPKACLWRTSAPS